MPEDVWRQWLSAGVIKTHIERVGGLSLQTWINQRMSAGRPVPHRKRQSKGGYSKFATVYRPVDIVACARADGMPLSPSRSSGAGWARYVSEDADTAESRLAAAKEELQNVQERINELFALERVAVSAPVEMQMLAPFVHAEKTIINASSPKESIVGQSGVYFLIENDTIVYVGQSVNVAARIGQHAREKKFDRVSMLPCPHSRLDIVEGFYINFFNPKLNRDCNGRLHAPVSAACLAVPLSAIRMAPSFAVAAP
ncbi:MAG: hypothetical protein P1P84_02725 [Deferrisomatales bacterium]|nr:hypothetical protein [Deferrisomatales bacterium]